MKSAGREWIGEPSPCKRGKKPPSRHQFPQEVTTTANERVQLIELNYPCFHRILTTIWKKKSTTKDKTSQFTTSPAHSVDFAWSRSSCSFFIQFPTEGVTPFLTPNSVGLCVHLSVLGWQKSQRYSLLTDLTVVIHHTYWAKLRGLS